MAMQTRACQLVRLCVGQVQHVHRQSRAGACKMTHGLGCIDGLPSLAMGCDAECLSLRGLELTLHACVQVRSRTARTRAPSGSCTIQPHPGGEAGLPPGPAGRPRRRLPLPRWRTTLPWWSAAWLVQMQMLISLASPQAAPPATSSARQWAASTSGSTAGQWAASLGTSQHAVGGIKQVALPGHGRMAGRDLASRAGADSPAQQTRLPSWIVCGQQKQLCPGVWNFHIRVLISGPCGEYYHAKMLRLG